jgi:hypothetical protein
MTGEERLAMHTAAERPDLWVTVPDLYRDSTAA